MTNDIRMFTIFCILALVIMSMAAGIVLSIKVNNPSPDLRDGIKQLYFISSVGAAAIIGLASFSD